MKNLIILLLVLLFIPALSAQKKIKWISWEEAVEKSANEKRKVIVDVYTEWCGWCKKMDKETFRSEFIVDFVNNNFYAVKFDAEYKEDIVFKGQTYQYVKKIRKGYHELAKEMTKGKLSFPTVVFLDENFDVLQPIPGYQDAERFEMIITYFAGDYFKTTPWRNYTSAYTRDTYAVPVKK